MQRADRNKVIREIRSSLNNKHTRLGDYQLDDFQSLLQAENKDSAWAKEVNYATRYLNLDCIREGWGPSLVLERAIPLLATARNLVENVPQIGEYGSHVPTYTKYITCRLHWLEQYTRGELPCDPEEICKFARGELLLTKEKEREIIAQHPEWQVEGKCSKLLKLLQQTS